MDNKTPENMTTSTHIKRLMERPDNYKLDIELSDEHWETVDKFDEVFRMELLETFGETITMRNRMLFNFGSHERGDFLETYVSVELRNFIIRLIDCWKEKQMVG